MNTPIEQCKQRAHERKDHPTLDGEKVDDVIDKFAKGLTVPHV